MRNILLVAPVRKPDALEAAQRIAELMQKQDVTVMTPADSFCRMEGLPLLGDEKPDAVISIGGDGTLLRAASYAVRRDAPLLGINMGRLGFLTETENSDAGDAVSRLLAGDYTIENRALLEVDHGQARYLVMNDVVVSRGGRVKDLHGAKNVYYQVNATYYSALGENDQRLLIARAIQLFMPGKPQIWYLDLFAGRNDYAAVERAGAGGHKEINRTNLSAQQMKDRLKLPVVKDQLLLMRVRNQCPAFADDAWPEVTLSGASCLHFLWEKNGCRAELSADLSTLAFEIKADLPDEKFSYRMNTSSAAVPEDPA